MTLEDLQFALELNCVMTKDIDYLLEYSKKNGIHTEDIDTQLLKLGYDKVFDNQYEEDNYDDYFNNIQKFPNKARFYDE
ncbi:hypothetical protein SMGD1_0957 [Sulfurimonas gotlandica GD1]|uniref:Uncharacterized protein n=1 Tax=Sulfurimonas gotlandica (strain DSM 19862 / JCM 16533 / GD1) TaxID=929558 RepID=B6BLU5_SULGG|nr:hypothetical protein [Sulfurimonas gotlandica]EDZ61829.1 conserved hypothetical protein [Sulfurimonas gotlandica GD1]EHP29483.1 hypothetical protein SMGD1_0957 [Sulfurimonas gotlandica GD1]